MRRSKIAQAALIPIVAIVLAGCTTSQGVQNIEQVDQAQNQEDLVKAQPAPRLDYSAERDVLIRRLKELNDKNLIGYVYLMSDTGQVIASYVTQGKVSSLNSYLTSSDVLINASGEVCSHSFTKDASGCVVVEAPDYDGSYGHNPDGIFFFTDTGALVEWSGRYVWTDQPLAIKTPVSLVREVK